MVNALHVLASKTLFRGGQTVWLKDAQSIGGKDNDWCEVYNRNGVKSRNRQPPLHAQDRHRTCRGTHNTPTLT